MDYITQVGEMACYHRLKCLQFMYIYTPNKIPTNSTDDSVFMHFTLSWYKTTHEKLKIWFPVALLIQRKI